MPDTGPSGTIADIEDEPLSSDNISLYVVRAGDSLSGIAKLFGVSANTILWANDIKKGQAIQPGQTLVILPVSGVQHTVVAGETVRSIAKNIKGKRRKFLISTAFTPTRSLPLEMLLLFLTAKLAFRIRRTEVPLVSYQKNRRAEQTMYASYSGYYMHPLSGAGHKTQGIHGYNGVDIGAPNGTLGRRVCFRRCDSEPRLRVERRVWRLFGYQTHTNGTQTLYAHMNGVIVGSRRASCSRPSDRLCRQYRQVHRPSRTL